MHRSKNIWDAEKICLQIKIVLWREKEEEEEKDAILPTLFDRQVLS